MNHTAIQSTCLLYYCDKCGARIAMADLKSGVVRLDHENKAICTRCGQKRPSPGQVRKLTPHSPTYESDPALNVLRRDGKSVSSRPVSIGAAKSSERRFAGAAPRPAPSRRILRVGGALTLLILLGGGSLLLRTSDGPPRHEAAVKPLAVQPVAVAETRTQLQTQMTATAPTKPPAGQERPPVVAAKTVVMSGAEVTAEPKSQFAAGSAPKPELVPQSVVDDYNPREMVARSLLLQAKQAFAAAPEDPWTYQDRLNALVSDHSSTAAGKEAVALLAELKVPPRPVAPTGEQAEGLVLKPGLLARYFSGKLNDRRKKLHVAQPLTSLEHDYGGNGPAAGVPGDHFETEAMGVLRISEPGEYTFIFIGDDFLSVWIDGKCIGNAQWDRQITTKVNLQDGDHPIKIVHSDSVSNSSFRLKWKRPGQKNEENIPAGALFHYGNPEEK